MRTLSLCPLYDTVGKVDASGAFYPEARTFMGLNLGSTVLRFDSNRVMTDRRAESDRIIARYVGTDLDAVAFFCHGWSSGIQAGYALVHTKPLAALLSQVLTPGGMVILYCCSTAQDPEGGFAARLSQHLGEGHPVFAHETAGHTTYNPYAYRFVAGHATTYVSCKDADAFRTWRRAMRSRTFRFEAPFLKPEQALSAAAHELESAAGTKPTT